MTRKREVQRILDNIEYKNWKFNLLEKSGGTLFIQVGFLDHDVDEHTNGKLPIKGRKHYISPFATKSEIVQTCLLAVLTAEEHEARENFKYQGAPIFNPHWDVDDLYAMRLQYTADVRV